MLEMLSYIISCNTDEKELAPLVKLFKEHLDSVFGSFENKPPCQVTCLDSSNKKGYGGSYIQSTRKIEVVYADNNFSKSILLHEMTHNALHCLFGKVPRWLNEGLADYANFRSGKIVAGEVFPEMLKRIERAFKEERFIDLEKLTASEEPFLDKGSIHLAYSESWAFVHYLVQSQKLPDYLERFKNGFSKFFTKDEIKEIEPNWIGYMDALLQSYC